MDNSYRQLLATIDSELREDNIKSIKFLCEPYIGTKKSSSYFSSGFDIFEALEKSNKLSEDNLDYLCELLYVIGRVDLATLIDIGGYYTCSRNKLIDQFRVMLFKLSEELGSEDLVRLRYLYGNIPKRVIIEDGIDIFKVMLQHKSVSPKNLGFLRKLLEEIDRHDLVGMIDSFDNGIDAYSIGYTEVEPVLESTFSESAPDVLAPNVLAPNILSISGSEEPMDECQAFSSESSCSKSDNESTEWSKLLVEDQISRIKLQDLNENETENIPVSMESAQAVLHPEAPTVLDTAAHVSMVYDESYTPIEYYKMTAVPRGICVIIDNQIFKADPNDPEAARNLGNRDGSDKDSAALRNSFERLKFTVDLKQNLTDQEIISHLRQISALNHENFDCFICCILTHGGENHIYGVNGRKVLLGSITSMFSAQFCPSLARKPKLFFMASCRGRDHQPALQQGEPLFDTDRPEIDFDTSEWVPNEADFLFGYSTVVNHVSYRSKSQGTFYINELTKVLDNYAHRDDLQTLLLRVNKAVSDRIYSREENSVHMVYKQTPAPQHTLRKQLKFL